MHSVADRTGTAAALLGKDWAVFRPLHRAGVALVFVLAALQTVRADEAFLWVGVFLACALAGFVPAVEWRQGTDRLLGSLPVSRDSVVLGRYAAALMAVIGAWAAWVAMGLLLAPLHLGHRTDPGIWSSATGGLTLVLLSSLLIAAFLPLLFKFGFGVAAAVFAPIAIAIVLAARTIAMGIEPHPVAIEGLPPALTPPAAAVRAALDTGVEGIGLAGTALAVLLALGAIMAASAWVSARAFRQRPL